MMEKKIEGARDLGFLLTEAPGALSRESVTIASGEGVLAPGTVLGQVTASKKFVASPNAEVVGKEGGETATAILAYRVDATASDVEAVVIDMNAEVKGPALAYHASVDDATKRGAKATQLRGAHIKVR